MWLLLACATDGEATPPPAVTLPPPLPAPPCALRAADVETPPDPRLTGPATIVVWKERRRAAVYRDGALAETPQGPACWPVALAPGAPPGPKLRQGDLRTPEGWYRTSDRPWSKFYHALNISYPGAADADRGLRDGLVTVAQADAIRKAVAADQLPPDGTKLGGQLLLHGGGSSADWTLGCVGFEDEHIDALRALLPADLRTDVLLLP